MSDRRCPECFEILECPSCDPSITHMVHDLEDGLREALEWALLRLAERGYRHPDECSPTECRCGFWKAAKVLETADIAALRSTPAAPAHLTVTSTPSSEAAAPQPDTALTVEDRFMSDLLDELERARAKFPDAGGSLAALTEEVGELAKAVLSEPPYRVRAEAVQVATMAMRVAIEGDHTLDPYRTKLGLRALGEVVP